MLTVPQNPHPSLPPGGKVIIFPLGEIRKGVKYEVTKVPLIPLIVTIKQHKYYDYYTNNLKAIDLRHKKCAIKSNP